MIPRASCRAAEKQKKGDFRAISINRPPLRGLLEKVALTKSNFCAQESGAAWQRGIWCPIYGFVTKDEILCRFSFKYRSTIPRSRLTHAKAAEDCRSPKASPDATPPAAQDSSRHEATHKGAQNAPGFA